jgi:hypothetical protein
MSGDRELQAWLDAATRDLPEEVARTVRNEIEAHYEDAVADYLAEGHAREEAQALALADLGKAPPVGRSLRRVHLSPLRRLWLGMEGARTCFRRAAAAQRAPGAFPTIDLGGALLFGLWVLVVHSVLEWQHFLGIVDLNPVTPVALAFVLLGLLLEGKLAPWNYPAFGWLLLVVPFWLIAPLTLLREPPGPNRPSSLFFDMVVPLLPALLLALVGVWIAHRLRREQAFHVPPLGWTILALLALIYAINWVTIPAVATGDPMLSFPALLTHLVGLLPLILYMVVAPLTPAFAGLWEARRNGRLALLIVLAHHYASVVHVLDLSYSVDFYAHWEPTRALHIAQYVARYLPAISTFFITPWMLLRAGTKRGRALAAVLPWSITLVGFEILAGFALVHTARVYSALDWLRESLNALQYYLLPLTFAVVLYGQYEGRAHEQEVEAPFPAGDALPT